MLETQLHLINGVVILLAAVVPIYLTLKLRGNFRKLTAILIVFILTHAVYCWLDLFGFDLLSDGVFEPLSAAVLLFFGMFYYRIANQRNVSIKNMVVIWNPATFLLVISSIIVILLLATLCAFVLLAARSKDIRSFQFQISIFIIIWVSGQVVDTIQESGIVVLSPLQVDFGLEMHVVSLVFLCIMLCVRFYYSERSVRRIIEGTPLR